jgi:hypothetical protein
MTAHPATLRPASITRRLLAAAVAATLGLFVAAPLALAAPDNDHVATPFNGALNGGPITINGGTFGATVQTPTSTPPWPTAEGEPLTPYGPGACSGREMNATTWYRILGNGGTVSINTTGSDFDTVIAIYPAPTPSLATALACNDDASASTLQSAMSVQSVAGSAYLIQVGGCTGNTGCGANEGNLTLNVTATPPPPVGTPDPIIVPQLPPDADGDGVPETGQDLCPGFKPTRDENKDGCQDKPKPILSRLGFEAQPLDGGRTLRGVRMSRVQLTLAPKGARVSMSCTRCRKPGGFRSFSFTTTRSGTQPVGRLSGVSLLRGGRLTMIITSPERLGRKLVLTLGKRRPEPKYSCLAVGSRTKRVSCSSGT